jgi:hypothetical protein
MKVGELGGCGWRGMLEILWKSNSGKAADGGEVGSREHPVKK